ncbi:MAG: ubiquitin-like small modifier protein 1 [Candidatus Hodarchaeales archaeon]|jgi:molybdopterin synthase sulfur carrier subunit
MILTSQINNNETIKLTTRLFGAFKQITIDREVEIQLKHGSTVLNLLRELTIRFPDLQALFFNEDDHLHSWITILRNGRNINIFDGIQTMLEDNDLIAIFPPVAGG